MKNADSESGTRGRFRAWFENKFDVTYLLRVLLYALVSVLAVGLIFYVGFHLMGRFEKGLDLCDAVMKTVTTTVEADAFILRDETPVYAYSSSGSVTAAVADGSKVPVGGRLANVYAVSAPEIEKRIAEIDVQIAELSKHTSEDRSLQSTTGLDASIYDCFFAIAADCADGNAGSALARRVGLLVDMQKRAVLRGTVADYATQISALSAEKISLTSQLGTNLETVSAQNSGYFYAEYDGFGETFSSKKIADLTWEDFEALTESEPVFHSGLCVGTLLTDFKWYIACPMTKTEAAELVNMYSCSVQFLSSAESFNMKLTRILTEPAGDGAVAILCCEFVPSAFDFTRMQRVRISTVEYSGFELPMNAVRMLDGYQGVYVLDGVTVRFRRVNVIHENEDGTVICTGNSAENEALREEVRVANRRAGGGASYDETSLGTYYWIEENDVVIVGGTDLYSGKIMS
ncbi:MAG: hypothetical protein IKQ92_01060 [Clostridia bacterium]|nr:hypothetical protein [Clostridia bacterium]